MLQNKWNPDYQARKWFTLFLVIVVCTIITAACQPSQTTPTTSDAEPTDFPAGFPTPDPEILEACLAEGGRWEMLGFSGPGCNLPTSDGGKACRKNEDCESGCLGDPNVVMTQDEYGSLVMDQEKIEELNAMDGEIVGICSPWQENFGCQVWLQHGQFVVICVD